MSTLATPLDTPHIIKEYKDIRIELPKNPLAKNSLRILPKEQKAYTEWSNEETSEVFLAFKEIANVWEETKTATQYLVYGRQVIKENSFNFEVVPYYETSNFLTRILQQIVVLWKITFGSSQVSKEHLKNKETAYRKDFEAQKNLAVEVVEPAENVPGKDAFCNEAVINKQSVLEGKNVRVLYNYAPIGFGGERLHFLLMPKRHEADFNLLTNDEYSEIDDLSKKIISYFSEKRKLEEAYIFRKFGKDAGQTVDHGHLHVVLTSSKVQSFMGKLSVFKNMLITPSPLPATELQEKVESLRLELKHINE